MTSNTPPTTVWLVGPGHEPFLMELLLAASNSRRQFPVGVRLEPAFDRMGVPDAGKGRWLLLVRDGLTAADVVQWAESFVNRGYRLLNCVTKDSSREALEFVLLQLQSLE